MSESKSKLPESAKLQYQSSRPISPESRHTEAQFAPATPPQTPISYTESFAHYKDAKPAWHAPDAAAIAATISTKPEPVAIIVCHGMGEQVRYETLGGLAASLLRAANPANVQTPVITFSRPVDTFIARAEIQWTQAPPATTENPNPAPVDYNVHLYEAYWAPITEGTITYYETLKFLVSAGWRGIISSRFFKSNYFRRWMFGRMVDCEIKSNTGWSLLAVLITLGLIVSVSFAVGLQLASQLKALNGGQLRWSTLVHFLLPFFSATYTKSILLSLGLWKSIVSLDFWKSIFLSWGFWMSLGFWVLAYVFYFWLRNVIVQYAGDVAAYISPFKASKFQKIRDDIQKVGFDIASLVYGFTSSDIPHYRKILIVGHSLGSVLAYDTLNAMMNLDQTCPAAQRKDVIGRTASLITFGSPLNKTAFLFRNQPNHPKDPLREQMVGASQPLIVDYSARAPHFRWTNLFSPMDIISGSLTYYDDKDQINYPVKKVVNCCDKQAWIPIWAHTQYWDNALLNEVLLEEVRR